MCLNPGSDFKPEDGNVWKQWDFSAPIFESFLIYGPPDFTGMNPPECLYEYPPLNKASDYNMEYFLFLDGPQFTSHKINTEEAILELYSLPIKPSDHILSIRSELGNPLYFYSLRFRFTPFSRPSVKSQKQIDEFIFYRDLKQYPSCLFAICFVASHPFHDLYFRLLKTIVQIEASSRITSSNLIDLSRFNHGSDKTTGTWPNCTYKTRKKFLKLLYDLNLPSFNEYLVFQINQSLTKIWRWKMPSHDEIGLQMAVWGSKFLFQWMNSKDFISLLSHLFLEYYVIVIGENIESIVRSVSLIPQLIYPFFWTYPIITILPDEKYELLGSPVPLIVGLYKSQKAMNMIKSLVDKEATVFIDLDKKEMIFPRKKIAPKVALSNEYSKALKPLLRSKRKEYNKEFHKSIVKAINDVTNIFIERITASIITKVDNFLPVGSMFSEECYQVFFVKTEIPFVQTHINTQMFYSIKEQICRKRTDDETKEFTPLQTLISIGAWNLKRSGSISPSSFEMDPVSLNE
ncbi:hypothetical protein TRFO_03917 [Tritrichomonas foetus]|uniref:cDENN domain-containing protein n=1 Tax=Tritrichomonas foetus TaxID=1144522 RepID=A0A1J4KKL7_9EUKA|nr:hypothetical protein TRFO_03917 [Tritrichomonas foetus]|eukprot:OHT11682.1 hypothetical protein TRFO_03917 [Tritrichomonas foetus]